VWFLRQKNSSGLVQEHGAIDAAVLCSNVGVPSRHKKLAHPQWIIKIIV